MLSEEQLQHFKQRLTEIKEEAEEEMERHHDGYENGEYSKDNTGDISSIQDHPADSGTEMHEQSKEQTLFDTARERYLAAVDGLEKIEKGTYGKSEISGKDIPVERLEAMPTARIRVDEEE
ncbi:MULTISPECIES: TraR/DksA C4-type zinc finger protein [Salimicrobium]|uniref:Uncharacterized protein n=4 Tax=Salimicrobium TaxID=351195 RepID=K2GGB5_9BACI|nr:MULTISPECIES: hypothetical protein [Salimicrobium]AKG04041.1 hypothetical protein AAV35_004035 [Salimicrobium jeotgali]EKE33087.1 hypothetical protein MJ3_01265 [Salimicrobium jeotgali]MBM7694918.1 RNA polymerase-binding transcription factor DksA [Salimicrobium jeotgali]PBB06337.1 hypothetical protein CKW00_04715 [Salimicrobium humidisoli]SDY02787.1 transcriptional regulator, TraR/DksA family [Salimicrobium album]